MLSLQLSCVLAFLLLLLSSRAHSPNVELERPLMYDASPPQGRLGHPKNRNSTLKWRASMVHKNPGEGLTQTKYSDPGYVKDLGFNVMVKNDGRPPHTAITWESFDPDIFPAGSQGRKWVEDRAAEIDKEIAAIHAAGMKAMYWSDIFVLPRVLVDKYWPSIVDSDGEWSFDSDLMIKLTKYMLDAVFERFPDLDGLVIRTGEIYTHDVPYHQGSSPIKAGPDSHIQLLKILDEIVIRKHNKLVFYRTWSFDGFHTDPKYYRRVADAIEPHPNLVMVIKHTKGDYWRTLPFNPTLGIGPHPFMVEIQCQREYEGKGAIPDYVMKGIIDGFEENAQDEGAKSLTDLVGDDLFQGILAWPRGGGWHGPYPANEFWIDMNVDVIAKWALDMSASEEALFHSWVRHTRKLDEESARALREIALLSAKGTLYGHYSLAHQMRNLPWTRDYYIGGADGALRGDFETILANGLVDEVLSEKAFAVYVWEMLPSPAKQIRTDNKLLREFIDYSLEYAILLYTIIWRSWIVQLKGMQGDRSGDYDVESIREGIEGYDLAMQRYSAMSGKVNSTGQVSSLYVPFQYLFTDPDPVKGVNNSVNMWRWVLEDATPNPTAREELR
jgi:hypothetical protein